MKIIEVNKEDNSVCFLYWNWKKLKFERTCWAKNISALYGLTKNKKHFALLIYK